MSFSRSSTIAPRRFFGVWFFGGVIVLASIAGAAWALQATSREANGTSAPPPPPSLSAKRAVGFGYVDTPNGMVRIYPSQPGKVVKIEKREEDGEIDAGTVLFRMDDTNARAQLEAAKAALAAAEQQVGEIRNQMEQLPHKIKAQEFAVEVKKQEIEAAKIQRDQIQRLADKSLADKERLELAKIAIAGLEKAQAAEEAKLAALRSINFDASIAKAEQDIKAKKALVDQAQYVLDECTVRTRVKGTVLRTLINENEMLGPNPQMPAVIIAPSGTRIIRAEIEQEYAGRIKLNQTARIEDDTRVSDIWKGKVIRISDWFTQRRSVLVEPLQFNDVRTLECIIELDPSTPPLKIGQRMRITLEGSDS